MRSFVLYDCYMAALTHNVLKMVRRLRRGVGLPGCGRRSRHAVTVFCVGDLVGLPSQACATVGPNVNSATFSTEPVFDHSGSAVL